MANKIQDVIDYRTALPDEVKTVMYQDDAPLEARFQAPDARVWCMIVMLARCTVSIERRHLVFDINAKST